MSDFPSGIRVFKPTEAMPSFIKATIVVSPEFMEWYEKNKMEGEVKLDIKESKDGTKYYLGHNTYKSS